MGNEGRERQYRRIGQTAKCPACGVSMDPEAYRCPKCRIYFCFKCRRRVQPRDAQYQCMNQQCKYYGKLLCSVCVVEVPRMGEQTRAIRVRAFDGLATCGTSLLVFILVFTLALACGLPSWGAGIGGVVLTSILAGWMSRFTIDQSVKETVEVGRSKCCIACKQAVEHLR